MKKLCFTNSYWNEEGLWFFCVDALDEDDKEYCISYEPPVLDRDEGEEDWEYSHNCAEATNWSSPAHAVHLSERWGDDEVFYDFDNDPSLSAEYFWY